MRPEVQRCRRSGKAYPHLVAAAANYELHDFSCSGASILNGVLGARSFSSTLVGAAQVGSGKKVAGYAPPSPEYDAARPDIVTITLGMDDIVFSDIVHDCYLGSNCVTTVADTEINRRLGVFKTNLETLLGELKDRGTAAEKLPRVVLTNYYDPFYPDSKKVCNDTYLGLGQGLAANEIDWIRAKVKIMNDYIAEASKTYPQAVTVDISKILVGHEYCSGDPWVYGISIWYKDFGNSAPFHPTPEGQQAIANRVSAAISKL
jgi:lysophospholipase L1-like esterase